MAGFLTKGPPENVCGSYNDNKRMSNDIPFRAERKYYVRNSWAIKTAEPHNHRNNFRNWNATKRLGVPSRNKPPKANFNKQHYSQQLKLIM